MIRYVNIKKPKQDEKVLALLRPYVREWFKRNFKEMIIHQKFAVELIHKGKNTLITAPTGSGKTLSSFLSILDHLFRLAEEGKLEDMVYCIYISPLKALDNDIHRNLLVPLKEIREIAKEQGIELPEVRIGVRTGDTSANEKQKQLKKPPHILVTTPETIAIVLSTRKFKEKFKNVKWVVVDEIHELANSKRGVHLSLSLERLQDFVGKPLVRIGMGACLKADQKIWLSDKIISIGEFVEKELKSNKKHIFLNGAEGVDISNKNIFIFSFDGKKLTKNKILKVWRIPSPTKIAKIETKNGKQLWVTLNDRLLSLTKNGYEWKYVEEIKEGEKICSPLYVDINSSKDVLDLILESDSLLSKLKVVCDLKFYRAILAKKAREKKITLKELCKNENLNYDWLVSQRSSIKLKEFLKMCETSGLDVKSEIKKWKIASYRMTHQAIRLFSFSPEFMRFLGLIASDGHNKGDRITIVNKEIEVCKKVKKFLSSQLGLRSVLRKVFVEKKTYYLLVCKSRALCEILNYLGIKIGRKFSDMSLHPAILSLPNYLLLEFLKGYLDGDGSVVITKDNKIRISIHSTSEKMIDQLRYILFRNGISSSKEIKKRVGKWHELYSIRIFRNEDCIKVAMGTFKGKKIKNIVVGSRKPDFVPIGPILRKFKEDYKLSFKELNKLTNTYVLDIIERGYCTREIGRKISRSLAEKFPEISKEIEDICNNMITSEEIKKIEILPFREKYVYDLTVENSHNFVAEGIIVHNTLEPLDEVARFLVGYENGKERSCTIVDARFVKPMDIKVLSPVKDIVYTPAETITSNMYKLLHEMISKRKTTLVFTNTRSGTERVVHHLKQMFPEVYSDEDIGAHHSSVSRDIRLELEEKLKKGLLKAIISSTSLELGIDIGYIDLVVQLGSPKSISRCLQRIGRAGHKLHETSVGRIICMDRDDLVECAVMIQQAYQYFLDKTRIPQNCLDVLAQHLMGMSLEKKWNVKEAFNLIRNSYCYRNLRWEDFLSVLEFLSGSYHSLEDKKVYAKIWFDAKDMMFGRRGKYARVIYSLNIGTIPDEVKIKVRTLDGKYIGSIEEEFLQRLLPGDVFVLAGKTYEFVKAKQVTAFVKPVKEKRPTVPSWFSEMLPLSFELALKIQEFRGKMFKLVKSKSRKEVVNWLLKNYYLDEWSANSIYEYFFWEYKFLKSLGVKNFPDEKTILVENYIDEKGNQNIIFHTLFGRRINDALSRAFGYLLTKKIKKSVGLTVSDNGFVISIPSESIGSEWLDLITLRRKIREREEERIDPREIVKLLKSYELEEVLKKALKQTELIKRRFRHCATRSLMILRNYKGYEIKVARQQMNADRLLKICEKFENFPVLKETYREVMEDFMDIKNAKWVLEQIEKGKIKYEFLPQSNVPTPFAHNLIVLGESDVVLMEDRKKLLLELHKKVLEKVKI